MIAFWIFTFALGAVILGMAKCMADRMAEDIYQPQPRPIIRDISPQFIFIRQIQAELARHDRSLAGDEGLAMARNIFEQHLADEKAEFGDPRFSWDKDGAISLAHAYEIEYWDDEA